MSSVNDFRAQKDEFFRRSPQSPLPHETRRSFAGLSYYDEDDSLRLQLPLTEADRTPITVQTSDGQERVYERAATVAFSHADKEVTLTLYRTPHSPGFFLPFRDATSGSDTYGAGRYLDVAQAEGGSVTIDFNLAYNPFCAYNEAYSCPLPPTENWLSVPIEAGERNYS